MTHHEATIGLKMKTISRKDLLTFFDWFEIGGVTFVLGMMLGDVISGRDAHIVLVIATIGMVGSLNRLTHWLSDWLEFRLRRRLSEQREDDADAMP
jgi:hypothetical protein